MKKEKTLFIYPSSHAPFVLRYEKRLIPRISLFIFNVLLFSMDVKEQHNLLV